MSLESTISNIETQAAGLETLIEDLKSQLVFKGFNKLNEPTVIYEDGMIFLQWNECTMSLKYAKELMEEEGFISVLDFKQWYFL